MTKCPSHGRMNFPQKYEIMQITKDLLDDLTGLQEDVAASFTDENFISGEVYWTIVESLATAKLAELRGEVVPDFV